MATSSSIDWTLDRQTLVNGALRLAQGVDWAIEPSAVVGAVANEALNGYLKHLMSRGPHLWRQTEGVLFLTEDEQYYDLGTASGGDHATKLSDFVSTTLSAAAVLGAGTITVASITSLASGDFIGIELADGTRQWTTINGAPAGSTVTLTDVLTGAADSAATVYSYTTKVERPVRITGLRRRVSGNDTPVELVSRQEYFEQANKAAAGKVNIAFYDRQVSLGRLYVWPTADNVEDTLRFTYERTFEDMDVNGDNFDVPGEWLETIRFGLGYRLAIELGRPLERIMFLKGEAEQRERELLGFDQEDASVYVQPDIR